jgi:hypothetical protein
LSPEEVAIRRRLDGMWVDTRFVGFGSEAWSTWFADMGKDADDRCSRYLEVVFARRLLAAMATDALTLRRFPEPPLWRGRSATSGRSYSPAGGKVVTSSP